MQQYAQKRKQAGPAPAAYRPRGAEQLPNSVRMAMAETMPSEGSVYADALKAKFMEHQLPSAEREADRIASGIHASTPEQVKAQLGEKMGADFSSVRFHTDGAAAGQAEQMGARAFTTGRDVYFGQGGFDAATAAHELVHTVQQGSVAADMSTLSAPAGEVQMKPGNWFTRGVARLWEKTGGSIRRSHQRAYEDIMKHKTDKVDAGSGKFDGSYYHIGKLNRALNFMNNPLAVMHSWFADKNKWLAKKQGREDEEKARIEAYKQSLGAAGSLFDKGRWATQKPAEQQEEPEDLLNQAFIQEDENESAPVQKQEPKKEAEGKADYDLFPLLEPLHDTAMQTPLLIGKTGHIGIKNKEGEENYTAFGVGGEAMIGLEALKAVRGTRELWKATDKIKKAHKGGLLAEKIKSVAGLGGVLGKTLVGAGNAMKGIAGLGGFGKKTAGALSWMDKKAYGLKASQILGTVNDSLRILQGGTDIASGLRTRGKLGGAGRKIAQLARDKTEEKEHLASLHKQAKHGANQRILQGSVNTMAGGLNIAGTFTKGVLSPIFKGAKYGVEKVGKFAVDLNQKSMNRDLLNEEMGLEDAIERYAAELAGGQAELEKKSAFDYRALKKEAKHIILKAHGFSTGKRSEAAAYFTGERAKYLAHHANSGTKDDEVAEAAKSLVDAMGVSRSGKGEKRRYAEGDIASRLGLGMNRQNVIASRGSNIAALAARGKGWGNGTKRFFKWLVGM